MGKFFVGQHVIRIAEMGDIPFIMNFLDNHWEKGCLLSRDRAYFEYEFVVDERVNFVVASHKETGIIDAVHGFIQCSRTPPHDIFGVIWVCKPKSGTKFLGLAVGEHVGAITGARAQKGVGLKADTGAKVVSDFFLETVSKLDHFYRLAHRENFSIADVSDMRRVSGLISSKKLIPIPTMRHLRTWFDLSTLSDAPMHKDAWYIERRYYLHPYYKFNIWGIEDSPGNIIGLLVGRVVDCCNSSALRIVDFFGPDNALDGIGGELDSIMDVGNIEYTDFYCAGISHENMQNAGFVLRDGKDRNIIPNHFEPFERINVDILHTGVELRAFKGDGDQGRPRTLRLPTEWCGK